MHLTLDIHFWMFDKQRGKEMTLLPFYLYFYVRLHLCCYCLLVICVSIFPGTSWCLLFPFKFLQLSGSISYSLTNEYTIHNLPFYNLFWAKKPHRQTPPLPFSQSLDHLWTLYRFQLLPSFYRIWIVHRCLSLLRLWAPWGQCPCPICVFLSSATSMDAQ